MTTLIVCDGCGDNLLERNVALKGDRVNGACGGGLPDREFHLCSTCGVVAFHAAVTRSAPVDEHKLASAIYDTRRAEAGAR